MMPAPSQISVNSQTCQLHNLTGIGEYNGVALNYTIANLFATQSTAITGTGRLTFTSAGALILTAPNTYSGGTTISSTTSHSGGTLSPGNSFAALATGTATFASGATFEYEIDSTDLNALSTAADLLVVNGDLNLDLANGTLLTCLDLDPTLQCFPEDTTIFALINYSGTWKVGLFTHGANVFSDGERFMAGEQQWEIDYNRTSAIGLDNFTDDYLSSSSFVAITAVPEPSTLVLMAINAGLAAVAARRRHASGRHRRTDGSAESPQGLFRSQTRLFTPRERIIHACSEIRFLRAPIQHWTAKALEPLTAPRGPSGSAGSVNQSPDSITHISRPRSALPCAGR